MYAFILIFTKNHNFFYFLMIFDFLKKITINYVFLNIFIKYKMIILNY